VDHCEAIDLVLHKGQAGEVYNVGTGSEMENLQMVEILLTSSGNRAASSNMSRIGLGMTGVTAECG